MHFIGIISEEKEYKNIKNELKESITCQKLNIINLNEQTIKNYANIKFNSIIICKEIKLQNYFAFFDNKLKSNKIL